MAKLREYTPEEEARIEEKIENTFAFVPDVLDNPSILDDIPNESNIELTPIAAATPDGRYVARSRRFAVSIKGDQAHTGADPGKRSE